MTGETTLDQKTLQNIKTSLTNWIRNILCGDNIAEFTKAIAPYKWQRDIYQELSDLQDVLQQLNSELLNMFDNYLCYAGSEDQTQMTRLSKLACNRAEVSLKTKRHNYGSLTQNLLIEACDKLCSVYWEENKTISNHEQEIVYQVARQILNAYQQKMVETGKNTKDVNTVHSELLMYCEIMMNHCLDYSGRLNNVQNEAIEILEASIQKTFQKLKRQSNWTITTDIEILEEMNPQAQTPTQKKSPEVDATTTPMPLNKAQVATLGYKHIMEYQWAQLSDHVSLWNLHDKTVSMVTANLSSDEKDSAITAMKYYFAYISELFEESRSKSPGKCLCINFAQTKIEFGIWATVNNGNFGKHWICDASTSSASTTLKFNKQPFLDLLIDFLLMPGGSKKNKQRVKIIGIFKMIWQEGENVTGKLDQVIIVIPTWFDLDQVAVLRDLAHESNFTHASFLRESSLAAFSIGYFPMEIQLSQILIAITVGVTGVYVEAFFRNPSNVIKLLTVGVYEWEMVDPSQKSKGQLCFQRKPKLKNLRLPMTIQENPVAILCATFDQTVVQLQNHEKMHCFLLTDSPIWKQSYKTFLKFRTTQVTDLGELDEHFALKASIQLSRDMSRVRSYIVDYPMALDMESVNGVNGIPDA